jgi:hypothetical protein
MDGEIERTEKERVVGLKKIEKIVEFSREKDWIVQMKKILELGLNREVEMNFILFCCH